MHVDHDVATRGWSKPLKLPCIKAIALLHTRFFRSISSLSSASDFTSPPCLRKMPNLRQFSRCSASCSQQNGNGHSLMRLFIYCSGNSCGYWSRRMQGIVGASMSSYSTWEAAHATLRALCLLSCCCDFSHVVCSLTFSPSSQFLHWLWSSLRTTLRTR